MVRIKKTIVYDRDLVDLIEDKIPTSIKEAMLSKGWNALGIYELVKEELKSWKKMNKKSGLTKR